MASSAMAMPRLHVEDAWPVQPAVLLAKGHALDLPDVPHRIEVAQDERLGGLLRRFPR